MSQFVVSARKYRPGRFDEVVGQEQVSQTLKNALKSDHLAQAFLFCGPRGVGKTTCARILAKVLNCENRTADFEPCNACDSCTSFNRNASFNITELDAASNNSVEHIRALIEQVRFQPQKGKYKVYIIDEVHMLSTQAFNAFLKTLEEPPSYAIFILATTEKHKIIPTILSRCQIFDFNRIQVPEMKAHLEGICAKEGLEYEQEALQIIAEKADGALRDALSIFDRIVSFSGNKIAYDATISSLNVLDYDYFFRIVDALLVEDMSELLMCFDQILRKGFEPDVFLMGLAAHIRNVLVCKDEKTWTLLEVSEPLVLRFKTQAQLADLNFLITALDLINDCDVHYKLTRNKRLHVEMTLIKMCYINRVLEQAETNPEKKTKLPTKTVTPSTNKAIPHTKKAPTPPEVKPITPLKIPNKQAKSIKKGVSPNLSSIAALRANVKKKEAEKNVVDIASIPQQQLEKVWSEWKKTVTSPSIKSMLELANIKLEKQKVCIEVSSTTAKSAILAEKNLRTYLMNALNVEVLPLELIVNAALSPAPVELKPRMSSDQEKYKLLLQTNPLLGALTKKFNLAPDN